MSQTSIRLIKTPDIDKIISYLKWKYTLLSDADIIKLAISEKYQKYVKDDANEGKKLREKFAHELEECGKIGDKIIKENGLMRDDMIEQQIYCTVLTLRIISFSRS